MIRNKIFNKWDRYGFLFGIKSKYYQMRLAIIMEDIAELLEDYSDGKRGYLGAVNTFAFPAIRRIFVEYPTYKYTNDYLIKLIDDLHEAAIKYTSTIDPTRYVNDIHGEVEMIYKFCNDKIIEMGKL